MNPDDLLGAALGALEIGVLVLATDGSIVEVNPAAAALLGIDASADRGALDALALTAADGTTLEPGGRPWDVALAGTAHGCALRRVDASGPSPLVRAQATPLLDDDGGVAGCVVELGPVRWHPLGSPGPEGQSVAEARVAAAFSASPLGMAIVDAGGRVREANQAFTDVVARRRDDVVGARLVSFVVPEEAPNVQARLQELSTGHEERAELEVRVLDGDGQLRWLLVHLVRLAVQAGREPEVMCQVLDVTDRRRFEEQLRHVADHDSLTGLVNRRSFEQVLAVHCAETERYGGHGALLVLDIDHFKVVNDAFGHLAGDQLIVMVAQLLKDRLRASDTVARLGGDEFAALLPHATRAEAEAVAEALLRAVRTHDLSRSLGTKRPITVSIGVAPCDQPDTSPTELLAAADLAMYAAKEAGRDRWTIAQPVSRTHPVRSNRVTWVERIEQALDAGHFRLVAQPVVAVDTGEVRQYELLVRMVDDAELVGPERFLYLAERVDLVSRIDRWVVGQAIDLLEHHATSDVALSVNVSGKSLASPLVLDLLTTRLPAATFDRSRLVFEVSEAAAMASVPNTQRFVDAVAAAGCRSALDDFGAGLGSLSYLKYLPFDLLKIDGAVVTTCLASPIDRTIITAIATMADELGKETVAESVPDDATLASLRKAGVDFAQGYFIGHPVPVASVLPLDHGAGVPGAG